MNTPLDRRRFLAVSAAVGAGVMTGFRAAAAEEESSFSTTPHKALLGQPGKEILAKWKAAGFEGMETVGAAAWQKSPVEAARDHLVAEKLDMRIHSVLFGWTNFNSPDAGQVNRELDNVKTALRAAEGYGADTVLLVPCQIKGMRVPDPWKLDIRFNEKTGHLEQVVAGDNGPYAAYIEAHNHATDASRKAIEQLLPTAERAGVVLALENVWNNLWSQPELFAHFVASFDSHWVQAYLDLGNHVKYAPTAEWIRALGRRIVKCHVKDFRLNPDGHGGRFVPIREGSVDWPAVRRELDAVGYNGWMTIEGGGLSLAEQSKRLDLILAGK